ncbi:hypothetical protein FSP39_004245, partial [Pinctada imbricata]
DLKVEDIDLLIEENSKDHHADKYDLTDSSAKLVLRRASSFSVKIRFSRKFNLQEDTVRFAFTAGDYPQHGDGSLVHFSLTEMDPRGKWSAEMTEEKENEIKVQITIPADCLVCKWQFKVEILEAEDGKTIVHLNKKIFPIDVYIIFNPWNKADTVYLEDDDLLQEYVLNDTGAIWVKNSSVYRPWSFGQFEKNILDCTMYLLDSSDTHESVKVRGNSVLVSRKLSAVVREEIKIASLFFNIPVIRGYALLRNFHVWNEVWMRRPDIPKANYDGWQVIDCTPQEESQGIYQCGPIPVAAIKEGDISYNYDGAFIFAEVNADIVTWVVDRDGTLYLSDINRKHDVGPGKEFSTQVQLIATRTGFLIFGAAFNSAELFDISGGKYMDTGIKDCSEVVYQALCKIVGYEEHVKFNRVCSYLFTSRVSFTRIDNGDIQRNISPKAGSKGPFTSPHDTMPLIDSGSRAEGLNFKTSDHDIMCLIKELKVIQSPSEKNNYESPYVLLIEKYNTKPGFVRLKPLFTCFL